MAPHFSCATRPLSIGLVCLALAATSNLARADLALTPAAIARGFTLTTFASDFPLPGGSGPLGIAFRPDGRVLVAEQGSKIYLLPSHADDQIYPFPVTADY